MAAPLLPLLQGCAAPLTALPDQATAPDAQALLAASAAAHGMPALAAVANAAVSYAGQPTRGALAEVDAWGYLPRHGVRWPTRFQERLLRPLPLPVHEWRLTGLDVNRGLGRAAVDGMTFGGGAASPAAALS